MLDFSAYLAAQHLTREAVNEAPFDTPVRPDRVALAHRTGVDEARQRIVLTLRRMADVILPASTCPSAPLPASR